MGQGPFIHSFTHETRNTHWALTLLSSVLGEIKLQDAVFALLVAAYNPGLETLKGKRILSPSRDNLRNLPQKSSV